MTVATQQTLFEFCTENGISEDNYRNLLKIVDSEVSSMDKANSEMNRQKRELERKHENLKEVFKESGERHKAKLMSVYYLLGSIRKMGTHHEKHVAVGYLQSTVDDLVKHDNLSWDQDLFELPF